MLAWRMRIAVLWVCFAVSMSAAILLVLAAPGNLDQIMEGSFGDMEFTAGTLMFMALFWLVPLIMAFLTMVLRDGVNRYANAGMGVVLTAMWAWDLVEHLVSAGEEFSGETLVVVAMVVAGLTILWHAWKWPAAHDVLQKPSPLVTDDHMTPVYAGTTPIPRWSEADGRPSNKQHELGTWERGDITHPGLREP
jgi:hypothetical protein